MTKAVDGCTIDGHISFYLQYLNIMSSARSRKVRKVGGGFGKESCVSTGVRKPGNTYVSPTAMI